MSQPDPRGLGPGAVLGILGGGQLARMLALAAADLGVRVHIFAPDADSPAYDATAAARGEADLKALYAAALA